MATKHNIEVKVLIDNENLINTGSVTDTYGGGRFGIAKSLRLLKGKDSIYVHKELIKQLEYLMQYSKETLKACEAKEQKSHSDSLS